MPFTKHLPGGQMACGKHSLIVCPQCCVDFDGEVFQRGSDDSKDEDRVFVLAPGVNRFTPQLDDQVLGPKTYVRIMKYNETLPQIDIQPHFCTDCELTWLVGEAGSDAAKSHPSHHTLIHPWTGDTRRSLLVHVDRACTNNGQADAKGGVGVFFGSGSRFNVSQAFDASSSSSGVATNQKAELDALVQAMRVVRMQVLPARAKLVGGESEKKHLRLILATDSSYAVECMCEHWKYWEAKGDELRNKQKKVVTNSKELLAVQREAEALSHVGVQVMYYHVRREQNSDADALAKAGVGKQAVDRGSSVADVKNPAPVRMGGMRIIQD